MSAAVKAPHVFRAINRITAAFAGAGMPKSRFNAQGQYHYRSIDDLLGRLGPLLAKYGLCILPQVLRRECEDRPGEGALLVSVRLLVRFEIVSARDGSRCTLKAWGEALDESDKGTAKAMSAAYKSAMLQFFCVPVAGEDADAKSPRPSNLGHPEPPEGWDSWVGEVIHIADTCECAEAIDRLRGGRRQALAALQRSRPDLYASVGEAIAGRLAELQRPKQAQTTQASRKSRERKPQKGTAGAASQSAEAA